jgi:hypothetical protein
MARSEAGATEAGISQTHSIVEAPTAFDAMLFAGGVTPPPAVLLRMFGDAGHVVTGRWVAEDEVDRLGSGADA